MLARLSRALGVGESLVVLRAVPWPEQSPASWACVPAGGVSHHRFRLLLPLTRRWDAAGNLCLALARQAPAFHVRCREDSTLAQDCSPFAMTHTNRTRGCCSLLG
ncbi:hypothetical protein PVAP13_2NG577220 [Panicum virgatum]|uniref:Uncharacterized protein n=1 Tax=Panicum virgatum TaxID=38727 RepID=A0A8T0VYH6_PANVG|nr:hypothetical protein PVAP13_2NG577220 [Panicum virgatum]